MNKAPMRALCVMLGLSLMGCAAGSSVWLYPQSHFIYPASNLSTVGRARGEASTTSLGFPVAMDADLQEQAIQEALKQIRRRAPDRLHWHNGNHVCPYYQPLHNHL